jgi:DNA-binding NtrC family response regulator
VRQKKILIVEDEDVARTLYRRLLDQRGISYDMAVSAEDARRQMNGATYEALATDMRLPDGNGADLAVEFHRNQPQAGILIITGSPNPVFSAQLKDVVPEAQWLFKPFEIEDFIQNIERLIHI